MKIICLFLLLGAISCEYPRYRPHHPKPFYPQIQKKFHRVPIRHGPPLRPPPIPVRMPQHHPIAAASMKRPIVVPFWKHQPISTTTTLRPPLPPAPIAPIVSFGTIRQVGEAGPIHTIPAPNLSPLDKPDDAQYQVTELSEQNLLKTYYETAAANQILQTPEFLQILPQREVVEDVTNYRIEPEVKEKSVNESQAYVLLAKEAAESLANLQQAGQVNSRLQKNDPIVVDEYDYDEQQDDEEFGHKLN